MHEVGRRQPRKHRRYHAESDQRSKNPRDGRTGIELAQSARLAWRAVIGTDVGWEMQKFSGHCDDPFS